MKAKSSFPIYTFLLFLLLVGVGGGASATPPVSTVGMPAKFNQLVLPGSELEAIHAEDRSVPVVLRIAGVWPHGTAFRYDLVYYALEPGTFDLRKYLQRKDRTATDDLPPIPVEVKPVLPPGHIEPNPL